MHRTGTVWGHLCKAKFNNNNIPLNSKYNFYNSIHYSHSYNKIAHPYEKTNIVLLCRNLYGKASLIFKENKLNTKGLK